MTKPLTDTDHACAACRDTGLWNGVECPHCPQKPLTDAELDALGKDARWDSLYGERAIKELRARRAEHDKTARIALDNAVAWEEMVEQNAKLAAALETIQIANAPGQENGVACHVCYRVATAALASVKGEQG